MREGSAIVGRDVEVASLAEHLEAATRGEGRIVLLVGEPGIGKTTLAEVVAARARALGAHTAWGRCWDAAASPAYWPLTQALSAIAHEPGGDGWLEAAGSALRDVLPELDTPPTVTGPALDPVTGRFATARAVSTFLRAASRDAARVLILDDVHEADAASLEALLLVEPALRDLPVLVLGTARDAEPHADSELRARLAQLRRRSVVVAVTPLGAESARTLVERHSGPLSEPQWAKAHAAAQGNPLFLTELGRLLATHSDSEPPLPAGVRQVVLERVSALPPGTRHLLECMCVVGREARLGVAAAIADVELREARAACEPAIEAGLLAVSSANVASFSHGLVVESLLASLDGARRAALHLRAADALEHSSPAVNELPMIAHHLLHATGVDRARVVAKTLAAAASLTERGGYEDAATLLGRLHDSFEADLPPEERGDVLLALASAELHAGRLEAGNEACGRVIALARGRRDGRLLARAALALGGAWRFGAVNEEVAELAREATAMLGEDAPELGARLLARIAAAEQPSLDPDKPMALARHAIAIARSRGDRSVLLDVLHTGMSALMDYASPAERRPLNEETLELARAAGSRLIELRASMRLVFDAYEAGDRERGVRAVDDHGRIAERLGHPQHLWPLAMVRAMRALLVGDFAELSEQLDRAREVGAADKRFAHSLLLFRVGIARARGETRDAGALEDEVEAVFRSFHTPSWFFASLRASLRAADHDPEGTRRALGSVTRAVTSEPVAASWAAEAAAFVGDQELARVLYDAFLPRAGTLLSWGATCYIVDAPYDHFLGLLAASLGHLDDAVDHAERAVTQARAANARPWLVQVSLGAAAHRLRRGKGEDGPRARALQDEAEALRRELGLATNEAVPGEAVGAPASTSATAPFSLARRGEVWELRHGDREVVLLKHSRGLELLDTLMRRPGEEIHVLELAAGAEARHAPSTRGDSGEQLDATARQAYRARLRELSDELQDAEDRADLGRVEHLRGEVDALTAELERAFGLGGRARRAGSATERARVAVQRRVKDAVKRIAELDPELGRHLEWAVRTGTTCVYRSAR